MKILLCGYHEAGYRALRVLVTRGHEVMVASHPTPPEIPSVAAYASALGVACVEGTVEEVHDTARRFRPDLLLSVYYRLILPKRVLELVPQGAFNFHPSLLPKHRGCFSAPWAIISADRETGVSCHRMTSHVDCGEIIDVNTIPIDDQATGMSLYFELVDATLDLFERVVRRAEQGPLTGKSQHGAGSYHDRAVPFEGVIDPSWSRASVDRFIRALDFPPYPPAVLSIDGGKYPIRTLSEYDDCLARHGLGVVRC